VTSLSTYFNFFIALVFILAIASNILSVVYELFAYYVKQRADFLKKAIQDILNDPLIKDVNLTERFYNHPQIDITKKTYRHLPQYISSKNFAQTLVDVICRRYEIQHTKIIRKPNSEGEIIKPELPTDQLLKFKRAISDLPYSDLQILLNGFVSNSQEKLDNLFNVMETWFTEYMNRVTGWYKVMVQKQMFILAIGLTVIFNFDLFHIVSTLLSDKALTAQIASAANNAQPVKIDSIKNDAEWKRAVQKKDSLISELYKLNAPVGWQNIRYELKQTSAKHFWFWVTKILGWLTCAAALSFGAPFWFDLLSNLVNLRKSGVKPLN